MNNHNIFYERASCFIVLSPSSFNTSQVQFGVNFSSKISSSIKVKEDCNNHSVVTQYQRDTHEVSILGLTKRSPKQVWIEWLYKGSHAWRFCTQLWKILLQTRCKERWALRHNDLANCPRAEYIAAFLQFLVSLFSSYSRSHSKAVCRLVQGNQGDRRWTSGQRKILAEFLANWHSCVGSLLQENRR